MRPWVRRVQAGWGPRAGASLREALALCHGKGTLDVSSVAAFLAHRGHTMDDVADWVDDLYHHQPRVARRAFGEGAVVHLATGWADGRLQMRAQPERTVPMENFRLRVRQEFQLASTHGVAVDAFIALVVVSCDAPNGGDESTHRVCTHVLDIFSAGETVTEHDSGKLLVLAERTPMLPARMADLRARVNADSELRDASVRMWVESVGPRVEVLDDLLDSLLV